MNRIQESARPLIQQTLHGYSDGHRLLASSVRLPKDAERLLLLLSDLSGPTGGEQFDPYLTGYPVESAGCYALARTWPAPEMPRPGCVWTHTLLIRDDLLGQLPRPEYLLDLFRRPSDRSGFNDFIEAISVPVWFEMGDTRLADESETPPSLAAGLIRALYGATHAHTVLTVPRYSSAESPFLSIWRLQWPSLRRGFTFCSGSQAQRSLEGEPFILQASLERDLRRLDRGSVPPTLVHWETGENPATEEWIREAVAACVERGRASLQEFIDRVGRDLPGFMTWFYPVVQAYVILNPSANLDAATRLIDFTAEQFPEAGNGREYKRAF